MDAAIALRLDLPRAPSRASIPGVSADSRTDAELIGCPLRITVGKRGLAEGVVEARVRSTGEDERIPIADAPERVQAILEGIDERG